MSPVQFYKQHKRDQSSNNQDYMVRYKSRLYKSGKHSNEVHNKNNADLMDDSAVQDNSRNGYAKS